MNTEEKLKQQDYYKMLLPEVPNTNLDTFLGVGEKYSRSSAYTRYAIDLPDVDGPKLDTTLKAPGTGDDIPIDAPLLSDSPVGGGTLAPTEAFGKNTDTDNVSKENLGLLLDVEEIKNSLNLLKTELRINDTKEELHFEMDQMIKSVRKEIEDLKARKVPVRKEYDTEGAYKEQLYPQVVNILDELLVPIINSVPDYNLLATQVSSTYEDGTIKNAIISVTVSLINNDYKYDFKVDVPVLNGLIQSPQYLTRARKVIPFTQEALYTELNSESFIKITPDYRQKENMFSNIGENMLRQPDRQKSYETSTHESHSEVSGEKSWIANKQRGLSDEIK